MPGHVRDGGTWKNIVALHVRQGGVWKTLQRATVRDGSDWKEFLIVPFIGFLRPDSDIETSDWSGTPLYQKLDETSPDDATTQISAGFVGNGGQIKDFEVGMSNPAVTPLGSETVTWRVRMWIDPIASGFSNKVATMSVKEGNNVRFTFATNLLDTGYLTRTHVMTQDQKDSIVNWDNVSLKVSFSITGDDIFAASTGRVTWAEVQFS